MTNLQPRLRFFKIVQASSEPHLLTNQNFRENHLLFHSCES
jgi:hypothetical protein